jgi:hypothetical protein
MFVAADALKLYNGSWLRCNCVLGSQAQVVDGIAIFTQLSLTTVGKFKLNITMDRGAFSRVFMLTLPFDVKPAAVVTTNSSVSGVYSMGDYLGAVVIAVRSSSSEDCWRMLGCMPLPATQEQSAVSELGA